MHTPGGGTAITKLEAAKIVPTDETYGQLQYAYGHLNRILFYNALPNCLITLQRQSRSYGYFCGARFGRKDGHTTDEIALNPDHFYSYAIAELLSTLGHEMAHLWQHHFGNPGRGRYHNREWAAKMHAIGLPPSDSGKAGGKETGDSMSNYIREDGPFAKAIDLLLADGFEITWTPVQVAAQPAPLPDGSEDGSRGECGSRTGKRVKYTCPQCQLSAWAKYGADLVCGTHQTQMKS